VTGHIEIDPELCKDCRLCISVCPHQLIEPTERTNQKGYCPVQFIGKTTRKTTRNARMRSVCYLMPRDAIGSIVAKVLMGVTTSWRRPRSGQDVATISATPLLPEETPNTWREAVQDRGRLYPAESELAAINMVIGASIAVEEP
jgi:hypothetical protein